MARSDPQVNIRMPEELKLRLEQKAKYNNRSLNAQIVRDLEFSASTISIEKRDLSGLEVTGDIPFVIAQQIAEMAEEEGISYLEMVTRIFLAGIYKDSPVVHYAAILPNVTRDELIAGFKQIYPSDETLAPKTVLSSEIQSKKNTAAILDAVKKRKMNAVGLPPIPKKEKNKK